MAFESNTSLFISTERRKLSKGRIVLPASFLQGDQQVIVTMDPNGCIDVWKESRWTVIEQRIHDLPMYATWYKRLFLSNRAGCGVSARRQTLIPSVILQWAGLEDSAIATLTGAPEMIRIWSEPRLRQKIESITDRDDPPKWLFPSAFPKSDANQLERDLLQAIRRRDYSQVENNVALALATLGFSVVELTQYAKDDGIDVAVHAKSASNGERRVAYVQCKASGKPATVRELRELIGTVARDGAHSGILVSACGFTNQAKREAATSMVKIRLHDVPSLFEFVRRHLVWPRPFLDDLHT